MKKVFKLFAVALVFLLILSGCNSKSTDSDAGNGALFKAGTYTAEAGGNNGTLTVEVVLTEDKIESVEVTNHKETEGLGDVAFEKLSKSIVDGQTLAVDVVSGATNSSNALLKAVEDCIKQAGGDIDSLKDPVNLPEAKADDEEITVDVVIVGGGGSGLTAAVTAAENGKEVAVLEKLLSPGGSFSAHSDGTIRLHNEEGSEFIGSEELYKRWTTANKGKGNNELIKTVTDMAPDTLNWVEGFGLKYYTNKDWLFDMETVTLNPAGTYEEGMGKRYTDVMANKVKDLGGKIYLETTGKSVIMNDAGEAAGVIAERADGSTLTVHADSVIIATGGFAAQVGKTESNGVIDTFLPELKNPELLSEDHPASDGSGIMMAVEAGSGTKGLTGTGLRGNYRLKADKSLLLQNALFVNQNANRFANEGMQYQVFYTALANNYKVFEITDSKNARKNIDELMKSGTVHKADTLEDLAKLINVDAAKLKATVEKYNSLGKKDTDFNKGEKFMTTIDQAPFYVGETFARIAGSIGGILVNENTQVLKEDGTIIPNLYACGDAANGNLHNEEYVGGGSGTTFALNTGRIAGQAVSAK